MRNNKLKKNLKKVGCAIFTFFFWYIVVGFFLKSNYPIQEQPFNGAIAYELIRDGLTLSAYFLAPAVGFLLFNDWREEHVAIKNEKLSSEFKKICDKLFVFTNTSPTFNNLEDFNLKQASFYETLSQAKMLLDRINVHDDISREYKEKTTNALSNLQQGWSFFQQQVIYSKIEGCNEEKQKYFKKKDENYQIFREMYQELKVLYV